MNQNKYIKLKKQHGGKEIIIRFNCINKDNIPAEIIQNISLNKDLKEYDTNDTISSVINRLNKFLETHGYQIATLDYKFKPLINTDAEDIIFPSNN